MQYLFLEEYFQFFLRLLKLFSVIDEEQSEVSTRAAFGWRQYYNIDDIYEWLDQILRRYPLELTNYNIGKTYEKRNIRAIKLSKRPERVIYLIIGS